MSIVYADTTYGQLVHTNEIAGATVTGNTTTSYASRDTFAYYDGFGRPIQVASTGDAAGQWILTGQVVRDARGRVVQAFVPNPVTATNAGGELYPLTPTGVQWTGTSYDTFGRVVQTTDIDGTVTGTATYHALSVESRDAEEAATSGLHVHAYTLATRDGHGRALSVEAIGNGGAITTTKAYQATGEVTDIWRTGSDNSGVSVNYHRSMQYDTMGRLVLNMEPNSWPGTNGSNGKPQAWNYAYDDVGDLVGTSDARQCGENFAYDGAGRLLSEDYSPCAAAPMQTGYSTPATNGDGTEAFYVYEGEGLAVQTSRVTDVYDRAAHTHFSRDARGRVIGVDRQLARPGVPAAALAGRYATEHFTAATQYDERDRVVSQTTGADLADLQSANATYAGMYGPSMVVGSYSPRGVLEGVTSSYGPIVTSTVIEPDGRPDAIVYGDAAKTTMQFTYGGSRRRLTEAKMARTGSFPTASPSAAGEAQPTRQTILEDDVIASSGGYDAVGNPLVVTDNRIAGEWPPGAEPVQTSTYVYDDDYRLTSVARTFASGTDAFAAPVADATDATSPFPLATPQNRAMNQAFSYDGVGNWLSSTDGAPAGTPTFFDRSLGTITHGTATSGPNQVQTASLAPATATGGALHATYDVAGNMVQLTLERNGACTGSTGCNQLFEYDWDEVGNLARARRFDFEGGETCVNKGLLHLCTLNPLPQNYVYPNLPSAIANADVSYAYDAGGTRVLRASTPAGEPTMYSAEIFPSLRLNHTAWDATSLNYDESDATEAVYLTLGSQAYGRVVDNAALPSVGSSQHVFLELTDGLGSTSIVVDKDTSELVERTTYLPYGALDSDYHPDRWNDFREDYKFTGKEDDVEIGLTYFGARYYSPQLGVWISPDPLAIHSASGDLNPYAYVHGRVTTGTDPDGLDITLQNSDGQTAIGTYDPSAYSWLDTPVAGADMGMSGPSPIQQLEAMIASSTQAAATAAAAWAVSTQASINSALSQVYGVDSTSSRSILSKIMAEATTFTMGLEASTNPVASFAGGIAASASGGVSGYGMSLGLMTGGALQMLGGAIGGGSALAEEGASLGGATPFAVPQAVASGALVAHGEAAFAAGAIAFFAVSRTPSKTLRKRWEDATGDEWPKDPKTGKNQDVSHKTALADNGTNEVDNIEPKPHDEHMQEHKEAGDFKRWGARAVRPLIVGKK